MQQPTSVSKHKHIVLTSHPGKSGAKPIPIRWGESDPRQRGPIVGTLGNAAHRNVIGTHSGSYAVYRALAIASGTLQSNHRADLTNTAPVVEIGPYPSWFDPQKIVSLDPFGAMVGEAYAEYTNKDTIFAPRSRLPKRTLPCPNCKIVLPKGACKLTARS